MVIGGYRRELVPIANPLSIVDHDSTYVYLLISYHPLLITDVIAGFEQNEYAVSEGDGSVTVCINLNNSIERNITITVSTQAATAQGKLPSDHHFL